jgi:cell surface protein SprA
MVDFFKGLRLRHSSVVISLFLIASLKGLCAQTGIKLPPPPHTVDLFQEELFGLEKYAVDSTFFALKPGNYKRSITLDSTGTFVTVQEKLDDTEFYFPAVMDLNTYVQRYLAYNQLHLFKKYFSNAIANLKEEEFGAIELDIPIRIKNETFTRIFGSDRISLRVTGNISFDLSGRTEERSGAAANRQENRNNFSPRFSQTQQFTVEGKIGEKVTVSVQQNSEAVTDIENTLKLRYDGDEDEIVESIEAGNVSLSLPSTKYVIFGGSNQGLFGLKANLRMGNLYMTTIASLEKGQQEELKISGSASASTTTVKDINYIQDRYFFLAQNYRESWKTTGGNNLGYTDDLQVFTYTRGTEILDLEVYVSTDPGNDNATDGAAVLDPLDDKWKQVSDYSTVDDDAGKSESTTFRRLDENQYNFDPYRGFFWVNQSVSPSQLLAVSYRLGNGVKVGTLSTDSSSTVLLKMIKPRQQNATDTYAQTWKLAMQNVYSLGGSNIEAEDFDIEIRNVINGLQTQGDKTFLTLLGLDILDASGALGADAKVDLNDYFIDRAGGILIFPELEPFNPPDTTRFKELQDKVNVYYGENATDPDKRQRESKYEIVVKSKSTKSTFDLGFYVLEGSEVVSLSGRNLVRDKDYVIDYFSGQLTLTSPEAKRASADLEIKYERANLFQLDKKTILGGRAEYRFLDNSFVGLTALYMNKTTVDQRVRVGQEPFQNFVWDVNAAFKFKPRFLTTAIDALPFIETSDESQFDIEGEFAQVLPDPNTLNSSRTGDDNGVAYIDDFEASKRTTTLGIRYRTWTAASAPARLPALGDVFNYQESLDKTRAHLTWFNPYNQLEIQDIWPERDVNAQTGRRTDALGLEFYRDAKTSVDSAWAGIMRSTASFADQQRTKYIELWVKGETGVLNIDIGTISEDWVVTGQTLKGKPSLSNLNTEDRDGLQVLDEGEDVGIDGLKDADEVGQGDDPAGDNWREPRQGNRADGIFDGVDYTGINGTEGNSRARGSAYPDTEDLDGDGQLNTINKYYTYSFSLNPDDNLNNEWQSGSTKYKNGQPTGWRQFRIPLTQPTDSVGQPDRTFQQILNVRLRLSNIENTEPERILIATFDFVGNEWQEDGFTTEVDTLGSPTGFTKADSIFSLTTYNTEENAVDLGPGGPDPYDSPPGVSGVKDRITKAVSKEQSLVMQFNNLPAGAIAEARKTLYSKMELVNYKRLKMFLYGSSKCDPPLPYNPDVDSSNIEFFLRFGSDAKNYYEYGQHVFEGWSTYNKIDIDLDQLAALDGTISERQELNNEQHGYYYATGNTVSLQLIRYFVIGIRNKNNRPFTGEVWLDEFRLSDVRGETATALRIKTNLKIADVMRFTAEWESIDADFHNISTQFGEGNTTERQSYSGLFNFHKLLPASWELNIPIDGRASYTRNIPKYLPRSDDLSGYKNDTFTKKMKSLFGLRELPADLSDKVSQSETIGMGTTITKSGKSKHWLPKYTIDNISVDLDYSSQNRSQWDMKYNRSLQFKERYSYKIPFSNDNFVEPFSFTKPIPVLNAIYDTKMYYSPSTINFNLNVSDVSTEQLRRDSTATVTKTRSTATTRSMSTSYKLFQNMNFTYSRNYSTDADFDSISRSQLYKNIITKLDFGKQTDVDQKFGGKYSPQLFTWLSPDFSYNTTFSYQLVSGYKYKQAVNNVSRQIGLTFKPGTLMSAIYTPEEQKKSKPKTRARPQRKKDKQEEEGNKDDKKEDGEEPQEEEEEKSFPNPLLFIYDALSSWQQVKIVYNANSGVSNQYLSGIPKWDYQFGFTQNPGIPQDTSLLSQNIDLKRPNIREGYGITTSTSLSIGKMIKANLSHNFKTDLNITNGGDAKTESESWTYFAYGKDPKKDFTGISSDLMRFVPDWNVKISGVQEILFFKEFAKSISVDHGHSGKYDVKRKLDDSGLKLIPTSESFTNNWSPLAAISINTVWDVSASVRMNNATNYSYTLGGGATRTENNSFTISMNYSKSSGFSIPLPFWPFKGRTFKNEINFTLTYDQSKNRSFTRLKSSSTFKEQSNNTSWKLRPSATYKFNTRVQGSMFFETGATTNKITGTYSYSEFGISVNIAIRD